MQGIFATDGKRRRKRSGQNLQELSPGYWKVTVNLPASQNADGGRHRRVAYLWGGVRKAEARGARRIVSVGSPWFSWPVQSNYR